MTHEQEVKRQEAEMRPCVKCGELVHPDNLGFHVCRKQGYGTGGYIQPWEDTDG